MVLIGDLDLPFFNLLDPAESAAFDAQVPELHAQGHWLVRTMLWHSVIGYQAARDLQRDPRLKAWGTVIFTMQGVHSGPAFEVFERGILNLQGADHTRLRALVARAFTMSRAEPLRPLMREYLTGRAAAFAAAGGGDVMAELVDGYPVVVLAEFLGLPEEDWPRLAGWVEDFWRLARFNLAEDLPIIDAAVTDMVNYARELVEARRLAPRDDVIDVLLAAEAEGDRLSHDELCDLVAALIVAGIDSMRAQIGQMLLLYAGRPDEWHRLQDDPSLVAAAVEETVRFVPGVSAIPRMVTEQFDYNGVTFPVGTMLTLVCQAANQDPSAVRCPMDFDVTADRGPFNPVTFGGGAHRCLGSSLARAEMQELLAVLTEQWESFELDGEPVISPNLIAHGPISLPLRVKAR